MGFDLFYINTNYTNCKIISLVIYLAYNSCGFSLGVTVDQFMFYEIVWGIKDGLWPKEIINYC